jgi:hypothetical protein
MAAFNFHKRRTRRWWYVGVTLVAAAFLAVLFVGGASANLAGSTFEGNDGNLVVNTSGNTDWCTDFPAPAATAACTTPITGLHTGIDVASGTGDNSLGQGTKEDNAAVKVVAGSIPPQKSDLTRFYEASELSGGDVFLYLAWERTNNLGNANMDFEINADGTGGCPGTTTGPCTISRSNGDILVTYDFGGSGAPTLGINRWLTTTGTNPYDGTPNVAGDCFSANALPCWGDHKTLSQSISEGAVNTGGSVVDPINPDAPRTIVQDGFGEAAINLTDAGVITSTNGCSFGQATTFLKSRSSSSFTSEVKDFIAPVQTPLVNNCGAIKISKTDSRTGDPLSGATFNICTNAGPYTTLNPCTAPSGITNPVSTGTDGTYCASSLSVGTFYVTEVGAPTGYVIDDTSTHTVSVSSGSCASPGTGDSLSFSDTPTSDIQVNFRDGGSGVTSADISCDNSTGTTDSTTVTSGWDTSATITGIEAPTTVTCTITIDP